MTGGTRTHRYRVAQVCRARLTAAPRCRSRLCTKLGGECLFGGRGAAVTTRYGWLDTDPDYGDPVYLARSVVELAVLEPGRILPVAQGKVSAIRPILGDRIDENLIRRVGFYVDNRGLRKSSLTDGLAYDQRVISRITLVVRQLLKSRLIDGRDDDVELVIGRDELGEQIWVFGVAG
jgi:hypothetical protein